MWPTIQRWDKKAWSKWLNQFRSAQTTWMEWRQEGTPSNGHVVKTEKVSFILLFSISKCCFFNAFFSWTVFNCKSFLKSDFMFSPRSLCDYFFFYIHFFFVCNWIVLRHTLCFISGRYVTIQLVDATPSTKLNIKHIAVEVTDLFLNFVNNFLIFRSPLLTAENICISSIHKTPVAKFTQFQLICSEIKKTPDFYTKIKYPHVKEPIERISNANDPPNWTLPQINIRKNIENGCFRTQNIEKTFPQFFCD